MPFPLRVPQPLNNEHCATGENPYWNADDASLLWADIPPGKLFRLDTVSGRHQLIYHAAPVGGFTRQSDGSWLLFRVDDIATLAPGGEVRSLLAFDDANARRFNDVIADPMGRVFAGTIGTTRESGGVYRVALDGQITQLWAGTGVANGMGFSPDSRTFYWTCSTSNRIYAFSYNAPDGALSERRLFCQVPAGEGMADGLTVDAGGDVWSARNGGARIVRYAPDGTPKEQIEFPVAKVNSLCFGGPNLDTLYVTTGGGASDSDGPQGTLYAVRVEARGALEFRSRVGCG